MTSFSKNQECLSTCASDDSDVMSICASDGDIDDSDVKHSEFSVESSADVENPLKAEPFNDDNNLKSEKGVAFFSRWFPTRKPPLGWFFV